MKTLGKLIACWLVYGVSILVTGIVAHLFHLSAVNMHNPAPPATQFLTACASAAILVIGLWPLASGLTAPAAWRAAAIGSFLLLALGVNGLIETAKFSHFLDTGLGTAIVLYIAMAVLLGSALGLQFGSAGSPAGFPHHNWPSWLWRGIVAWLGWPPIYLVFGMCAAPVVVPYYQAGVAGLHIPPMSLILEMQLIRSVLFLAASLPLIALWRGSRRSLWLSLGLAHAFTVGIYGLVGAWFFPVALRIAHSIEITADSFAYAGLLVLLFTAPKAATASQPAEAKAIPASLSA